MTPPMPTDYGYQHATHVDAWRLWLALRPVHPSFYRPCTPHLRFNPNAWTRP